MSIVFKITGQGKTSRLEYYNVYFGVLIMTITRIVHPYVNSITLISFLESKVEAGLGRNQWQF